MPLGNRAARAGYTEASLRVAETRARLDAVRDQIEQEIRSAIRDAQAAQKSADVAHRTAVAVAAHARDMTQQFEARLVSSYDVRHTKDELGKANAIELKAFMDSTSRSAGSSLQTRRSSTVRARSRQRRRPRSPRRRSCSRTPKKSLSASRSRAMRCRAKFEDHEELKETELDAPFAGAVTVQGERVSMPQRLVPAALVLVFVCAGPAYSQVLTTPQRLADPYPIGRAYDDLKLLDDDYNAGNWEMAVWRAKRLLQVARVTASVDDVRRALDFGRHYIIVTWMGRDAFDKPTIGRLIVHGGAPGERPPHTPAPGIAAARTAPVERGGSVDPFPADLPGVGVKQDDAVIEVFFSRGTRGRLADVYASTRTKDPIEEELSAFAKVVASPLFDTIGVLAGPAVPRPATAARPAPRELSVAATVSRVGLPFDRATITWKAAAKEPLGTTELEAAIADLADHLKFSVVPNSMCGQTFVDTVTTALDSTVKSDPCASDRGGAAECRAAIGRSLARAFADQRCGGAAPNASQRADIKAVDTKVRAFVDDQLTETAESHLTFDNRPETHFSLGAGAAAIASASLTLPRVKVGSTTGILSADPLPRAMTMAFVNWSPAGYDGEQHHVSWAERLRPFVGATLTPDFGVAGGANLLLVRGVGVLVGTAVMFTPGAHAEELGSPAANPDKPFAISYAHVKLFVGLGYNFK